MTTQNQYTFGDSERAARRLQLLAQVFEAPSRALIERYRPPNLELALDLGSGPGHTTRLLHEASGAGRTIGLEASERYLTQARENAPPGVEFLQQDVTALGANAPSARLVFSRFLLTHLHEPAAALARFRALVTPGGALLVQETAHMQASHPAFARYYELVAQMQAHYGQALYIGQELERLAQGSDFEVVHFAVRRFEREASSMAELHVQNLRTWRSDAFASRAFDAAELNNLERQLAALADGSISTAPVEIGFGELVLR
jgi:ubiquinone/menaquinone biosynthesis C-methylase UbiE